MSDRVAIPVNAGAGVVWVQYATNTDPSEPPVSSSLVWQTAAKVPEADIPTTVYTPPRPTGVTVWTRAANFDTNGTRTSNWSDPVGTVMDAIAEFYGATLTVGGDGIPVLAWTPEPSMLGARVVFGTAAAADAPTLSDTADLDADDLSYSFPLLPTGQRLTARLTAYPGWNGSEVTGTAGETITLSVVRQGVTDGANLGCRLVLTDALGLIFTDDLCLVTTEGV